MSEQRPPPSRPPQGPIGWLLSLAGRLIGLVIGALVLRVVLELAGLYFWWPQEGSRHVFQVMKRERVELVTALQPHPLGEDICVLLESEVTHILKVSYKINWLFQESVTVLACTLTSFMLRLAWLATMFPLISLCALTGLTEGLVQRDLRRFGSGLESVFLHIYIIKYGSSVTNILWIFYLVKPYYLPALLLLLPAALWMSISLQMAIGSFKRYF